MSAPERATGPAVKMRDGERRGESQTTSPIILTVSSICTSSEPADPRASIVYTPKGSARPKS
jgi:hypothetical protein